MAYNIVVIGGGFAGARVAQELEENLPAQSARLSLVNDVNFSLYTPFLPEAAAGTLEPRHVVTPLREILHRTHIRVGVGAGHDAEGKKVLFRSGQGDEEWLHYDKLVLALGSVSRVLPIPGLAEHAVGFKSLSDAIWLRNTVIERLEEANSCTDEKRATELLTFLFVGGGYAGLEALAELQDFAAQAISSYPRARLRGMRWILLDAAPRVLPEIDADLAYYATNQLRSRGIEILTDTTLEEVGENWALIAGGEKVGTRTVVWTAGVAPHPSLRNFEVDLGEKGHVLVDNNLQAGEGIWALGDCAAVPQRGGGFAPPTAQHALRQASVVANNILADIGLRKKEKYQYLSHNAFVNLGRYKAVGKLGRLRFSGGFAWWLARSYHLSQIPGLSRKVRAVLDWTVGLPFRRDLAELGTLGTPRPLRSEEYEGGGSHRPLQR